jgi:hypothetical protein
MEGEDKKEKPLCLVLMPDGRRLTYYEGSNKSHYIYDRGKRIHGSIEQHHDALLFVPEKRD